MDTQLYGARGVLIEELGRTVVTRNRTSEPRLHEKFIIWFMRSSFIAVLLALLWAPCCHLLGYSLLDGFGPSSADYEYELPGGLLLFRAASNNRVVCWSDESYAQGVEAMRQYGLVQTSILIDADVSAIGWNERYIVCYQADAPQADERKTGWWIVDTQQRRRIGPMDEPEFRSRLEGLGIAGIQIEPPEHWR